MDNYYNQGTGLYLTFLNKFIKYDSDQNSLKFYIDISGCNASFSNFQVINGNFSNILSSNLQVISGNFSNIQAITGNFSNLYTSNLYASNIYSSNITTNNGYFSNIYSSNTTSFNGFFSNLFSSNLVAGNGIFSNSLVASNFSCCNMITSNLTINNKLFVDYWSNNSNNIFSYKYGSNLCLGQDHSLSNWQLDVNGDINFKNGSLRSNDIPMAFLDESNVDTKVKGKISITNNTKVYIAVTDGDFPDTGSFPLVVGGGGILVTNLKVTNNIDYKGKPLISSQWTDFTNSVTKGIYYNEPTSFVGIGTTTPSTLLEVKNGCIQNNGSGYLWAKVFNDTFASGSFSNRFTGFPYLNQLVNSFNWEYEIPVVKTGLYKSLKIYGWFQVTTTDTYTFQVQIGGSFNLSINNQSVISSTIDNVYGEHQYTGSRTLQAYAWNSIVIEYMETNNTVDYSSTPTIANPNAGLQIKYKSSSGSYVDFNNSSVNFAYDQNESRFNSDESLWKLSGTNNVYLPSSYNCGVGLSNPSFSLDVVGSIHSSQNVLANGGVFNNIVSANSILNNVQSINQETENAQINNLTITQSVKVDSQLNKQVLNTIRKSNHYDSLFCTLTWELLNILFQDYTIVVEITAQVTTATSSGYRTERLNIKTFLSDPFSSIVTVVPEGSATASGNLTSFISLKTYWTCHNNSVVFESRSTIPEINIIVHNMKLSIIVIPDHHGSMFLS